MSNRLIFSLIAAAVACAALPAQAADYAAEIAPEPAPEGIGQPDWIVTLKATGVVRPTFEGSDEYGITGTPGLSIRRPGQPWKFGAPDDGFGFALYDSPFFRIGPVARIRSERDSDDQRKTRGLDDVDWAVEPGVFVEFYAMESLRLRGELRHGVNGHDGFVGDVAADYIARVDRFTVAFGPRLSLGDSEFMGEYFGVSRREARRNRRVSAYDPEGGIKSVGVAGSLTYDWTENWSTTAFGGYNRLVGDAGDSPIVKRLGSKDQFAVGLGVAYSFGVDW